MIRPTVVISLPPGETAPVRAELEAAGFPTAAVGRPDELDALLRSETPVGVAILDGDADLGLFLELYSLLHDEERSIPVLMVMSPRALERLTGGDHSLEDEFFARPYSAESLRWRVEAMCIRSQTVDDGSGAVLSGTVDTPAWGRRATIVTIFNPKGGVGKTTIATNLAAMLQVRKHKSVLLVDADTVTGHVSTSLNLDRVRAIVDAWRDEADGGPVEALTDIASTHESGLRVVVLSASPIHTEILEPERVATAIGAARRSFDYIIIDLHPSYSHLNQAIFAISDRILVPVTPDVPALQAAIQVRDVSVELGVRERLALVVNRANSGVSAEDIERTVGIPIVATIRSGGLLFVQAANEGKALVERYPKERVTADFGALADRLLGTGAASGSAKGAFKLFGRKEAARA